MFVISGKSPYLCDVFLPQSDVTKTSPHIAVYTYMKKAFTKRFDPDYLELRTLQSCPIKATANVPGMY